MAAAAQMRAAIGLPVSRGTERAGPRTPPRISRAPSGCGTSTASDSRISLYFAPARRASAVRGDAHARAPRRGRARCARRARLSATPAERHEPEVRDGERPGGPGDGALARLEAPGPAAPGLRGDRDALLRPAGAGDLARHGASSSPARSADLRSGELRFIARLPGRRARPGHGRPAARRGARPPRRGAGRGPARGSRRRGAAHGHPGRRDGARAEA